MGLAKILRDGSSVWYQRGEGLPANSVRSLFRDKAGVLWIGTSAGLVRWLKNRQNVFTTANGLIDNAVSQITEDDFGHLWLGTRYGLMRVNETEFSEVAAGTEPTLAVQCFGSRDGMKNEECSAANPVKTPDDKLWFPTADGLAMADTKALPKTGETPSVFLEEVRVGQTTEWTFNPLNAATASAQSRAVKLPARAHDINFRFSALDFFAPDRVQFKYRIEGLNEDWSAPSSSRVAHFTEIPPGNYRFRVQACSRDGIWSTADSSIAFTVPPLFWQTVWFRTGGAVAGVSLFALVIVRRIQKQARQKLRELEHEQSLERERARIARDIHDEVGAGLTEVALLSELAQAGIEGAEKKYLDDIFKTARDLTRSLDEIVWSINPANDSLEKLVLYLVEFSREFLGTASIPCRLEVPNTLPQVSVDPMVRHNICLAVKETLNNVVKHAEATEVRMEIEWEDGWLRIAIKDNGRGFARAAVVDLAATRDGLNNVSARMKEIGGCCEQQSGIGQGSRTALSVKIPAATS
jgi:signal transduction histidine kinase